MWSSINYNTSFEMINHQLNDLNFVNTTSDNNAYHQDYIPPLIAPLVPSMPQNPLPQASRASQRLSLEIQPCISVTEPTPITGPSLDAVDQFIAQHSADMIIEQQQPQIQPQGFLEGLLGNPGQQEAEWLSWTPNIMLSPATSVNTLDDFDVSSFHSLDLLNQVVIPSSPSFEDHLAVKDMTTSTKKNRRLSEPPTPTHNFASESNSSVRRTQSEKRSRSNSASHGSFPCLHPGCGKVFNRPYNLTSHMRTHTSEKPYACSQCGRKFARQHDRNRHEKLHWGIKPFACQICNKAFARMDALNRHLRVENGCGSHMIKIEQHQQAL
ncbi:Putative C2H2 type zinc finger domain protein [Rhizopus microsporus]|nr:Putative C2H2 type zinc finger domain protein [Rhizopus microsporus]